MGGRMAGSQSLASIFSHLLLTFVDSLAFHTYLLLTFYPPNNFPERKLIPTTNTMPTVHLLDYVAGNVRSLANAIEKVGCTVEWVRSPEDVEKADVSDL